MTITQNDADATVEAFSVASRNRTLAERAIEAAARSQVEADDVSAREEFGHPAAIIVFGQLLRLHSVTVKRDSALYHGARGQDGLWATRTTDDEPVRISDGNMPELPGRSVWHPVRVATAMGFPIEADNGALRQFISRPSYTAA